MGGGQMHGDSPLKVDVGKDRRVADIHPACCMSVMDKFLADKMQTSCRFSNVFDIIKK
jgi:hypothetical protein